MESGTKAAFTLNQIFPLLNHALILVLNILPAYTGAGILLLKIVTYMNLLMKQILKTGYVNSELYLIVDI